MAGWWQKHLRSGRSVPGGLVNWLVLECRLCIVSVFMLSEEIY